MELAFLLGLAEAPCETPTLAAGQVALLGARDGHLLREEGQASIRETLHFRDDAELMTDPEPMTREALSAVPRSFWFHLDLDVLSTEALPSVDYPQDGGIGWIDLTSVARIALGASPIGWDVTIYNPDLDPDSKDAGRIVRFLAEAIALLPAE
jgi:arginase